MRGEEDRGASAGGESGASVPDARRIERVLERLPGLRALVVGDLLLDEYRVGDADRISPEAPVPIVRVRSTRKTLGGAGNVAAGIRALGGRCELVALAGADAEGDAALECLGELGIPASAVVRTPERPTPHKLRVVARSRQMLRLDRESDEPVARVRIEAVRTAIEARLAGCDVILLQDYDKGLFADDLGSWIIELARRHGRPVVADPKNALDRFRGAALVKPNLEEAHRFLPGAADTFERRRAWLEKIQRALGGSEIVLTRGSLGMTALDAQGAAFDVPTRPAEVFDVQGAGDTSIAALALCRGAGASLLESCIVANAAASVAVEKIGTAAVGLEELRGRLRERGFELGENA